MGRHGGAIHFDGAHPGSGKTFRGICSQKEQSHFNRRWCDPENVQEILQMTNADGCDTASGIENEWGEWDEEQMQKFVEQTEACRT